MDDIDNLVTQQFRYKRKNEVKKTYQIFHKYKQITDSELAESEKKIEDLKEDIKFSNEEYENLVKENEDLEKRLSEKVLYWSNRVYKLRNKCKEKNNRILFLKILIFLTNAVTWHVTRVGINES